jgi:hypothetical protein
MARTYIKLRETIFDLYVERDQIPSYFRPIALISSWLVLIGYILFAVAFSTADKDLDAPRTVLTALGSALFIVGYIIAVAVALFGRSLLFLVDGILYPILTSSLMGLILTILMHSLHISHPVAQIYVSIPLVASCVTTAITGVLLVVVYRELSQIRKRDERRRWHVAMGPYGSHGEATSILSHQRSASGPEDEAQRRQLMRLLNEHHEHPSMENMRGTYKIDLPGDERIEARGRSASVPISRRFNISGLLPWNDSNNGTFKDARERRREEIERAGLPKSPSLNHGNQGVWSRSRSASREPVFTRAQPAPPTAWGWTPATRYA